MKYGLTVLMIMAAAAGFSQTNNKKTAQVIVSMKNAAGKPLKNEQVVFAATGLKPVIAVTHKTEWTRLSYLPAQHM